LVLDLDFHLLDRFVRAAVLERLRDGRDSATFPEE
jgi:hypothetical protein